MIYQLSPVALTSEITLSSADITLSLANNTLYSFTNPAISSINLDAQSGLKFCGFDFSTGSTAPTFTYPSDGTNDWIFEGADCSNGIFFPSASSRYRVAVEIGFNSYIGTVEKVSVLQ